MSQISTPSQSSRRTANMLVLSCIALWGLLALFGPTLEQARNYHAFADQRAWGWLPHALDVLSNLGFFVAAIWGAWRLYQVRDVHIEPMTRWMAVLFFVGLACAFVGSSFYHWAPDNAGLVWDRLAMCVPFAGIMGVAVQQCSEDDLAALIASVGMLIGGIVSVLIWQSTGNMQPWAVAQGMGMLALVVLALYKRRRGVLPIQLGWVIAFYALAKLFELGDAAVFHASHGLIAGHSLKHLVAACAALPVLSALNRLRLEAESMPSRITGTMIGRNYRNAR